MNEYLYTNSILNFRKNICFAHNRRSRSNSNPYDDDNHVERKFIDFFAVFIVSHQYLAKILPCFLPINVLVTPLIITVKLDKRSRRICQI